MSKLIVFGALFFMHALHADDLSMAIWKSDLIRVAEVLKDKKIDNIQKAKYLDSAQNIIKLREKELANAMGLLGNFRPPTFEYVPNMWTFYVAMGATFFTGTILAGAIDKEKGIKAGENMFYLTCGGVALLYFIKNYFECKYIKNLHRDALLIKELIYDA